MSAVIEVVGDSENHPALAVHLTAVVMPKFQLRPESIVLPRMSNAGPVYQGFSICKASSGKPLKVCVAEVPPGLIVGVNSHEANKSMCNVCIQCESDELPFIGVKKVGLIASDGENVENLELTVNCWSAK